MRGAEGKLTPSPNFSTFTVPVVGVSSLIGLESAYAREKRSTAIRGHCWAARTLRPSVHEHE